MGARYPHLMAPLAVGGVTFRNRLFTAPMCLHAMQAGEPYPTEGVIAHFANKARGGAACVTCGGVNIFPPGGARLPTNYDVYNIENARCVARLADRIHAFGARASMELGVVGLSRGEYAACDGLPMIDGRPGREMPESEMERCAEGFATTAKILRAIGFDMILLHFGHGLTMGQFLSPLTNRRGDKYGGSSLENRARFPSMIIDRIREAVGRDLLIELRISGSEFAQGGVEIGEAIEFTRMVQDRIDIIHVSAGMHNPAGMTITHPTGFLPPMPNVHLAEAVRRAGVKVPVAAIGGIQDLDAAEAALAAGKADILAVARGFIADPELGLKAREGRPDEVTPCIKCMRCHDSVVWGYRYSCSVNPAIGLEHELPNIAAPPRKPRRKVVVIGGGPAGMKAALTASERGHKVVLFERGTSLGGILDEASRAYFKYDLRRFKDYLVRRVMESGIDVRLNRAATAEAVAAERPDAVFAAIGADPILPPIPGARGDKVLTALKVYSGAAVGGRVAIIGGGQVGCETALHLARLGASVTLLEMRPELAPDATPTIRTELLLKLEAEPSIQVVASARCTSVGELGLSYVDRNGVELRLEADTVVVAAGMRSRAAEAEGFRACAPVFARVGDCDRVATVESAISSAYFAAISL